MSQSKALMLGIIAYLIWGLSPIYFKSIASLPASEIIFHRIIWAAFFCAIFILFYKQHQWWRPLFEHPKYLMVLFCTGLMLSANWLLYVWAINNHYMLEASLGYYINPLFSVSLGTIVLKERMRTMQWFAVVLALIGVIIQIILIGELPWISLLLALSFASYGIIRKIVPINVLPGMVVETWILVPVALLWLLFNPASMTLTEVFWSSHLMWLCILAGPLTLVPLILFNLAAKNLPYSTIGFLQYMSPTLVFLLAIFYFHENFSLEKLATFGFIWLALCVFSLDTYLTRRGGKFIRR
ncbi:EamA family transporter RarD [Orbus sturtevantii]|uniref:EamA family transporter RarD n=1 Tax=Orbus sturtevantii TaxID=3074109 RepID=UPI00370D7582